MPSKTRTKLERQKRKLESCDNFAATKIRLTQALRDRLSENNSDEREVKNTKENGIAALSATA